MTDKIQREKIKQFKELSDKFHFSMLPLNGKDAFLAGWQERSEIFHPFDPSEYKGRCNAGICCGPASGVLVLDIDDFNLFQKWAEKNNIPPLPPTRTHTTGGNGEHRFHRYPSDGHRYGNKSFKKDGFDIKADKGIAVAPGSIHPDTGKPYFVSLDLSIADAPTWLLDLCREKPPTPSELPAVERLTWGGSIDDLPVKQATKALIRDGAPKGSRSEAVITVIDALIGIGMSEGDIFKIFDSNAIGEKYREKGTGKDRWLRDEIQRARAFVATSAPPAPTVSSSPSPLVCLRPSQLLSLPIEPSKIFLDPFLAGKKLGGLNGGRGIGKTQLALSMANAVAGGGSFAWTPLNTCTVLYIDAEMPVEDARDRIRNFGISDNEGRFLYYNVDYIVNKYPSAIRPNLTDETYRESLKDDVILKEGVGLVIFDNLSALTPGIDENTKQAWDPVGQWFLSLRFAGVAVLYVHHTGKAGDQRGTSAREDFLDFSMLLKRPSDYQVTDGCKFICTFTKNRVPQKDVHKIKDKTFQLVERNGIYVFDWHDEGESRKQLIIDMLAEGVSYADISATLDVTKGYISRIKKAAGLDEKTSKRTE